jgi:GAF domain-containing protein
MLAGEIHVEVNLPENERLNVPFVRREGIRSYAALPLLDGKGPVGILFLNFRQPRNMGPAIVDRYRIHATTLGSYIGEADVFREFEDAAAPPHVLQEEVLQAVVQTICATLRKPVVLWLFEPLRERRRIRACAGTGVRIQYLDLTVDVTTEDTIVTDVIKEGSKRFVRDIALEPLFKGKEFADTDGWKDAAYFPIFSRGQCVGAFEVFYFESLPDPYFDFVALERLATIATVSIQNYERLHESLRIRDITQLISAKPDIRNALDSIAQCARDLTAADRASILLFDKSTDRFEFGRHAPNDGSFGSCRGDLDGLARRTGRHSRTTHIDTAGIPVVSWH